MCRESASHVVLFACVETLQAGLDVACEVAGIDWGFAVAFEDVIVKRRGSAGKVEKEGKASAKGGLQMT